MTDMSPFRLFLQMSSRRWQDTSFNCITRYPWAMPVFPFSRPEVPVTPTIVVATDSGKPFSWRYREIEGGIDCLVLSAKEASGFGKRDVPVTFTLKGAPKTGKARAVTGDELNDAVMAFVREDRALWKMLAVPNSPTGESKPVTVIRIHFT